MKPFLFHLRQTGNTPKQVFLSTPAYGSMELANLECMLYTNVEDTGLPGCFGHLAPVLRQRSGIRMYSNFANGTLLICVTLVWYKQMVGPMNCASLQRKCKVSQVSSCYQAGCGNELAKRGYGSWINGGHVNGRKLAFAFSMNLKHIPPTTYHAFRLIISASTISQQLIVLGEKVSETSAKE